MFTGSSFHNLGAAQAKLWHPNLRRAFGMMSKFQTIAVTCTLCRVRLICIIYIMIIECVYTIVIVTRLALLFRVLLNTQREYGMPSAATAAKWQIVVRTQTRRSRGWSSKPGTLRLRRPVTCRFRRVGGKWRHALLHLFVMKCSVVHFVLALISACLVTCVIRCDKPARVLLYSLFYLIVHALFIHS